MGNKIAHPDDITSEDIAAYQSTHAKKDHVLRLWVDLFNVKEDDSPDADLQWYKITEDVVPASVTCISDDPNTVYLIRAYNSQVERICDIKIVQPGTKLKQPTESFIHLKDAATDKHWGFNFTSAEDAAKFRDACLTLSMPSVPKSSSFGTLRLPGKKWKTGSTRDAASTKRSETTDGISSLRTSSQYQGVSRKIDGMITAPSLTSTMSLDRRELRRNKRKSVSSGSRQSTARVDSRSIFANMATNIDMNRQTELVTAPPPNLDLITEQSQQSIKTKRLLSQTDSSSNDDISQDEKAEEAKGSTQSAKEDNSKPPPTANKEKSKSEEGDTSTESDTSEYDKPATLSASHLNAILFSCENIAHTTDSDVHMIRSEAISEEDEEADVTLQEVDATILADTSHTADCIVSPDTVAVNSSTPCDSSYITERDDSLHQLPTDSTSATDSTLHKMLQSLPVTSNSNASFGIEAEQGDPSITSPLPNTTSTSGADILRRPSNRGQSTSSIFRSSHRSKKSEDNHPLNSSNELSSKMLLEYQSHLRDQEMYEETKCEDHNASLYQDSGFGGTVSTEMSVSGKSSQSKMSRQSSRMSEKSHDSIVTGSESIYSSSSSSQLTKTSDMTQVKPFTFQSDQSEAEDGDEEDNSSSHSFTTQPAVVKSYSSLARQSGATRKTGWLVVKNWMMHSKNKLTLASKRHWKRYWVTLRGTTLMFYSCDDQTTLTEEAMPRHMIYIDGSIAQSVPEHPKRDNLFSVSSAYGDAYLFQAPTQIEHDNWISSIHSTCASQLAKQNGKANSTKVLQSEIEKLQNHIDSDSKMKKMAELQLTVVKELKSRSAITKQINTWEENLERLFMDQYRFKCYLSSLQGTELPNPKYVLSSMSRATKQKLGKLGILNVTSLHSLICIRTPNAYHTYIGQRQKKGGILSTLRQNSSQSRLKVTAETFVPPTTGSDEGEEYTGAYDSEEGGASPKLASTTDSEVISSMGSKFGDNLTRILLPNDQSIVVATDEEMTVRDVLEVVCNKRQLVLSDYFLRIKTNSASDYHIPQLTDTFDELIRFPDQKEYDRAEVCPKVVFQVDVVRQEEEGFGMEVEAELAEDADTDDVLQVFIDVVDDDSPTSKAGIIVGDELLTINGQVVAELDMDHIDSVLESDTCVSVTVRSCRLTKPHNTVTSVLTTHADTYIDNMMCPPPPSQSRISDNIIGDLIVPAPNWIQNSVENGDVEETPLTPRTESEKNVTNIKDLLHTAEQVTHFCRMANEKLTEDDHPIIIPSIQPLTEAQKLRKIVLELINTEKTYVRDLCMLMERYLEPLKEETFLSSEEVVQLVGNIQQIVHFQKEFLKNLEESIDDESFPVFTGAFEFKKVLFSIAGSFIYYANHFKLYSSFCASHSRAQKVLSPDDNTELYEFLHARNPKQQHSATLESYLIKPIQRILKYPLLLQQLRSLTDPDSNEYSHLNDALKAMEAVAEHINEMQKIYEEFGSVFDDVTKSYSNRHSNLSNDKRKLELNVGDLQYYGEGDWLNAYDDISKPRKSWEHATTIFVFKHGVVLLCQEKVKGKSGKIKSSSNRSSIIDSGSSSHDCVYHKFLPVAEIQVRTLPTTHAGGPVALWELLHLKSASESRPEKIYHMACSNVEKRAEFLKHMRIIIRESVKKMAVPKNKVIDSDAVKLRHSVIDQCRHSVIESTKLRHSVTTDIRETQPSSAHTSLTDNRYSMNLDCEKLSIPELDQRSRTFGDLVDLNDGGALNLRHTSINSVNSDTSHGSGAVLVYSSQDPITYSSKGSLDYCDSSPPVWEKRSDSSSSKVERTVTSNQSGSSANEGRRSMRVQGFYLDTATEC